MRRSCEEGFPGFPQPLMVDDPRYGEQHKTKEKNLDPIHCYPPMNSCLLIVGFWPDFRRPGRSWGSLEYPIVSEGVVDDSQGFARDVGFAPATIALIAQMELLQE